MRVMKWTSRVVTGVLLAAVVFGSDGLMDALGIAGYLGVGGCLVLAWVLTGLAERVDERLNHRYRGRRC